MRRRDIMSTYCTVSSSDKFEFLYEYYYNYKNILSCERSCVIYMIESFMMKYHWDEYCKYYNAPNRNNMITRIAECMNKGEVIDFILEDEKLPDNILFSYKNYIAMRIDFRIFANALNSIGGKDEELIRRCLLHESFPNCCTKEFPLIAEWRSDTYCLCDVYQTAISQGFGDVIPNNSDLQF